MEKESTVWYIFSVWRSGEFTELNYGQDRLCGLDFQVEKGQHSVQAE